MTPFDPGMLGLVSKILLVQSGPEGLNLIDLFVHYYSLPTSTYPKVDSIGPVASIFSNRKAVIKHDFGDTSAALTAD